MAERESKRRRAPGEGSIFKGSDGRWRARLTLSDGKRKTVRAPRTENTATKARALLKELMQQRDAGVDLKAKRITVQAFIETWYNDVAAAAIRPRTREKYIELIELRILPRLGDHKLDQLRPEHIAGWLNDLRADGLASTTIRNSYNLLKRALRVAVQWGRVPRNVAELVDPPRITLVEPTPPTRAEARRLLIAADSRRLGIAYHVALILGLRLGEVLGMAWRDIDFDAGTLKISQQVQTIEGKTVIAAPKSDASKRVLPIPPGLAARLQDHWRAQQDERRALETEWREHGLVLASRVGTPISPRNLERDWYAVRAAAELPAAVNFHLLRHTCATMLADQGVNEGVIGGILGHSRTTGGITRRYTHATLTAMRDAVIAVEEHLTRKVASHDAAQ